MRVLLISHTCQSRTEGHPRAERLARLLSGNFRVLIPDRWRHYGRWRPAQLPENNAFDCEVQKVALPWAGPAQTYFHWYPGLARLLKEFQPDIIDIWEEPWSLVSVQTCLLRDRLLPQAKIISETEQNINRVLPGPFERFRAYTLRHADYAVGRNAASLEVLRAKGYTGPMEVVPNAVDAELFHPMNREECRRALGLTGFVAGYVGRLVESKGLKDMVEALAFCPPDVSLLFVGAGDLQPELERRAQELGKAGQLRFVPRIPLQELPQFMNALDVLVLASHTTPSWKEQFGRVIIEAHACRTPVIGSDSGAIPEVVGAGGLIVSEHDPQALAAAISKLRADPGLCTELGAIGRRQVEEHYTWQRVAERLKEIYGRVLLPESRISQPLSENV